MEFNKLFFVDGNDVSWILTNWEWCELTLRQTGVNQRRMTSWRAHKKERQEQQISMIFRIVTLMPYQHLANGWLRLDRTFTSFSGKNNKAQSTMGTRGKDGDSRAMVGCRRFGSNYWVKLSTLYQVASAMMPLMWGRGLGESIHWRQGWQGTTMTVEGEWLGNSALRWARWHVSLPKDGPTSIASPMERHKYGLVRVCLALLRNEAAWQQMPCHRIQCTWAKRMNGVAADGLG